jgi:O-antigen ligase
MNVFSAILLGLAVLATQALHGGLLVPAFSVPGDILLAVAALPTLWAIVKNPSPTAPASLAAVVVFLAYVVWRCAHARDPYLGRVEMGFALSAGLAFVIAYGALTDSRSRFLFLGIVLAGALAQAIVGFIQFAKGGPIAPWGWFSLDLRQFYDGRFTTRSHGFYINPNHFSWLMGWATLLCVSLAAWARMAVLTRVILIYLALVFVAADVLSGSRGGLASLAGGAAVFVLLGVAGVLATRRRGRGVVIAGAILLVAACVGAGWWIYSSNWVMQARVDSWLQPDVRAFLFEHGLRQFETAPLVGQGPGAFGYAARLYRVGNQSGDAIFAHDDWLQMLVEYGFVGFALAGLAVLILLGGGAARFFSILRRMEMDDRLRSNSVAVLLGAISAMVAFCLHSVTDFNLHIPANALLAGATAGLLAGTGGRAYGNRLPAGVLRAFGVVTIMVFAGALAFHGWKFGRGDCRNLLAANALAEGKVQTVLDETAEGLRTSPADAGLLANRARALYSYEASLQFKDEANSSEDEPSENAPDSTEDSDENADFVEEAEAETLTPAEREKYYREAAEAFSKALDLQPLERKLKIEMAMATAELGNRKEAERLLIDAIRLDPAHGYAYGVYGDFLYDADQVDRAFRIYGLGSTLPGGIYCGDRAQDIREERAPPAPDETDAEPTSNEGTSAP